MIQKLQGSITISHLIGWGVSISIALGGFFWAKIAQTDTAVAEIKTDQSQLGERTARLEEALVGLRDDNKEIKNDVKSLLKMVK